MRASGLLRDRLRLALTLPPPTPTPTPSWNWTFAKSYSPADLVDGSSIKVLFNYFPEGWTPPGSGAIDPHTPSALSIAAIFAIIATVLLVLAAGVIAWLLLRQQRLLRIAAAAAEKDSGVRDSLLVLGGGRTTADAVDTETLDVSVELTRGHGDAAVVTSIRGGSVQAD